MHCSQCGTTAHLTPSEHGDFCPTCTYRQNDRDQPGYGLAASTYGFLGEDQ
jgi:hypothetical protein